MQFLKKLLETDQERLTNLKAEMTKDWANKVCFRLMADVSVTRHFILPPKWCFLAAIYEDTFGARMNMEFYRATFKDRKVAEELEEWVIQNYPKKRRD